MRKREIYMLSALLIVFVGAGFSINAESFTSNALASAADVIVSVFIAFYLVDRISRRERLYKWEKVKFLMYRAIEATCDAIMFEFQTAPGTVMLQSSLRESDLRAQYQLFLDLSREITEKISELSHVDTDETGAITSLSARLHEVSSQSLIAAVTPHFDKLSLSIFPKILELDENVELISSFMEVEAAYRHWGSSVDTIEGDWGMPEEFAWKDAAAFCSKVGSMLKIIYFQKPERDARKGADT